MAADGASSTSSEAGNNPISGCSIDRIKRLYPAVNEDETPLPHSWSCNDKSSFIGLSQGNLRVHYKGKGKPHKEAAAVKATHVIPASCGIYYFEVKIISKGRDGYMGIGLSVKDASLSKLPGTDKYSYGYHGDSGRILNSNAGAGHLYGPTFTTGDVIGCGINLIDNTCFYTKNGVDLGVAFTNLPSKLYPTVGLHTPGEIVVTNFGQSPFMFNIEDMMEEMRLKTKASIERFSVDNGKGEWQNTLNQLVSTYLVHHGYCSTAEAFGRSTGQKFDEEIASIKNRQKIQRLVLAGRMGEAIDETNRLYPGLLEENPDLMFMLKCRQFVEMVNGSDSEIRNLRHPRSRPTSRQSSPAMSPHRNSISSPHRSSHSSYMDHTSSSHSTSHISTSTSTNTTTSVKSTKLISATTKKEVTEISKSPPPSSDLNAINSSNSHVINGSGCRIISDEVDVDMDVDSNEHVGNGKSFSNGVTSGVSNGTSSTSSVQNGSHINDGMDVEEMDLEQQIPSRKRQLCGGDDEAINHMLNFGRDLQRTSEQLELKHGVNEANRKTLFDAFSLLAYADPWNSPVGFQLDPLRREPVSAALNSAILESHNMPRQPPLELAIGQAVQTVKLMSKVGLGSCAFTSVEDYVC
ncbi:ran-binding protein 9-like [Anneissia japonica]|uniref:ran-binding protein 9-like n=1 Tax=Anneissia japonica TaxID=1529436 RepID=UPI0014259A9B|nr:ran-binding protein 9-like [Anneissia japonica]